MIFIYGEGSGPNQINVEKCAKECTDFQEPKKDSNFKTAGQECPVTCLRDASPHSSWRVLVQPLSEMEHIEGGGGGMCGGCEKK